MSDLNTATEVTDVGSNAINSIQPHESDPVAEKSIVQSSVVSSAVKTDNERFEKDEEAPANKPDSQGKVSSVDLTGTPSIEEFGKANCKNISNDSGRVIESDDITTSSISTKKVCRLENHDQSRDESPVDAASNICGKTIEKDTCLAESDATVKAPIDDVILQQKSGVSLISETSFAADKKNEFRISMNPKENEALESPDEKKNVTVLTHPTIIDSLTSTENIESVEPEANLTNLKDFKKCSIIGDIRKNQESNKNIDADANISEIIPRVKTAEPINEKSEEKGLLFQGQMEDQICPSLKNSRNGKSSGDFNAEDATKVVSSAQEISHLIDTHHGDKALETPSTETNHNADQIRGVKFTDISEKISDATSPCKPFSSPADSKNVDQSNAPKSILSETLKSDLTCSVVSSEDPSCSKTSCSVDTLTKNDFNETVDFSEEVSFKGLGVTSSTSLKNAEIVREESILSSAEASDSMSKRNDSESSSSVTATSDDSSSVSAVKNVKLPIPLSSSTDSKDVVNIPPNNSVPNEVGGTSATIEKDPNAPDAVAKNHIDACKLNKIEEIKNNSCNNAATKATSLSNSDPINSMKKPAKGMKLSPVVSVKKEDLSLTQKEEMKKVEADESHTVPAETVHQSSSSAGESLKIPIKAEPVLESKLSSSSKNVVCAKSFSPSPEVKDAVTASGKSLKDQVDSFDNNKKLTESLNESLELGENTGHIEEKSVTFKSREILVAPNELESSTESLENQDDIEEKPEKEEKTLSLLLGEAAPALVSEEKIKSATNGCEEKKDNSADTQKKITSVLKDQMKDQKTSSNTGKFDVVEDIVTEKPSKSILSEKKSEGSAVRKQKFFDGVLNSGGLEKTPETSSKLSEDSSHSKESANELESERLVECIQDADESRGSVKVLKTSDSANEQKVTRGVRLSFDSNEEVIVEKVISKPLQMSGKESMKNIMPTQKPTSISKDKNLLGITAECRVELEITKIPVSHQTKVKISEPSKSNIVVVKKDLAGPSPNLSRDNEILKPISLLDPSLSQCSNLKLIRRPPKNLPRPDGMVRIGKDDSMVNKSSFDIRRPGRKRAITIDSTSRPISPAVKVVRMDMNSLKTGRNMVQVLHSKAPQKLMRSAPVKTSSALEMLLMNRGSTSSICDASVANFCQVEQIVSEPDFCSTPMKQLKKLSKGSADSILKQIANGGQRFGAITISPVKPAPSSLLGRPALSSIPLKLTQPKYRPAGITRSSSVDDVIEGVVAGQGEISDQCLLDFNTMGEPKKKRGRPRKIVPTIPTQQAVRGHFVHQAPEPLFVVQEPRLAPIRPPLPALKPIQMLVPRPKPALVPAPSNLSMLIPEVKIMEGNEKRVEELKEEETSELQKSISGRSVRACRTVKEPKKKVAEKPDPAAKIGPSPKKKKKDELAEPDPDEESRKQRALEEEAKRKQEQKEKRQQERARKLELRSKALAEKKAKLKRRAEERKRQYYEKKQRLQEEKAEMERQRALAPPETFEEETQMGDELDDSIISDTTRNKKGRMEVIDPESSKEFKVQQVAEYQWPLQGGEFFMLQEQISHYLGVKSFKRKYPDIKRRPIEAEERTFLCDSGLVSETMCDLGLTALRSADVLDIMFADFHDKYEEFRQYLRDRQAKEFSLKQLALAGKPTTDQLGSIERAVQSAARWNSALNKSRQESRRCSLDLQTFIVQYPRNRFSKTTKENPKVGNYPVSLIPGQFADYYKQYSSAELRYFPINTVLYGPIKPYKVIVRESQNNYFSDSDDSSSSDGSSGSSSNGSDSEDSADEAPVAVDLPIRDKEGVVCKVCNGNRKKNKNNKPEVLIHCAQCTSSCHPTCLDLSVAMVPYIQKYNWQCTDCKKCARCREAGDEEKMLFCDLCDRGYHIYCVGLKAVPEGRWHCQECAVCCACGAKEPGPSENNLWHHEYKKSLKGEENIYIRSFCERCAKLHDPGEFNILKREN